jgi:hypothetical protein
MRLVVDMKKNPHFGQRRSGELGRKASRKKAMTAGMMQSIIMMKRRLGLLSIRNPRADESNISLSKFGATVMTRTDEENEAERIPRSSSLEKSI